MFYLKDKPNHLMKHSLYISFFLILIMSCSDTTTKKKKKDLPEAFGKEGKIIVVLEENLRENEVYKNLKKVLEYPQAGLLEKENSLLIATTIPNTYFNTFKTHKRILIPIILKEYSTNFDAVKKSINSVNIQTAKEKGIFFTTIKNQFAYGQTISYLIARDLKTYNDFLIEKGKVLRKKFEELEIKNSIESLKKHAINKKIVNIIEKKFNANLLITSKFKVALDTTNFIWLRQYEAEKDLNIFIHKTNNFPNSITKKNITILRNRLGKNYIFGNKKDKTSYMITESEIPLSLETIKINNIDTKQCRGVWRLNNYMMGGCFISHTFHLNKETYYIEAFLENPGKKKVKELRKLESILRTFKKLDN